MLLRSVKGVPQLHKKAAKFPFGIVPSGSNSSKHSMV